eukprot:gnl/MRDRNA2_/MRDRNA2_89377_c0_seq1.p1 gnl/MRDRNA2_/MRDRNA2_89377_c0~~gnl/MRDRNA2_/MRDRNA2_89377_c0_seq1.p1  ORF type:complete len:201 (+),score=72.18 gnl/MRDRNA2_/MRDRNA2_89377_c0_seq1:91-693(+)
MGRSRSRGRHVSKSRSVESESAPRTKRRREKERRRSPSRDRRRRKEVRRSEDRETEKEKAEQKRKEEEQRQTEQIAMRVEAEVQRRIAEKVADITFKTELQFKLQAEIDRHLSVIRVEYEMKKKKLIEDFKTDKSEELQSKKELEEIIEANMRKTMAHQNKMAENLQAQDEELLHERAKLQKAKDTMKKKLKGQGLAAKN